MQLLLGKSMSLPLSQAVPCIAAPCLAAMALRTGLRPLAATAMSFYHLWHRGRFQELAQQRRARHGCIDDDAAVIIDLRQTQRRADAGQGAHCCHELRRRSRPVQDPSDATLHVRQPRQQPRQCL